MSFEVVLSSECQWLKQNIYQVKVRFPEAALQSLKTAMKGVCAGQRQIRATATPSGGAVHNANKAPRVTI